MKTPPRRAAVNPQLKLVYRWLRAISKRVAVLEAALAYPVGLPRQRERPGAKPPTVH